MTSSCELKFDDTVIDWAKARVPDDFIFLFQESDRLVTSITDGDDDDERFDVRYSTTREVVLRRLDFGGYTAERAQECFEAWLDRERCTLSSMPEAESAILKDAFKGRYGELKDFSYDEWKRRILGNYIDEPHKDIMEICYLDEFGNLDEFGEYLIIVRAMLEALPNVREITLDITDLRCGLDRSRRSNLPD
jgi:hypothetical protein